MKNFKRLGLLALIVLALFSLAACSTGEEDVVEPDSGAVEDLDQDEEVLEEEEEEVVSFPVEVSDGLGNMVSIEEEPEKIVSLNPSSTEMIFALGLGDKVVGVSSNCNYPEEATTKEIVGDYEGINLERVVELDPDLVLVYGFIDEEDAAVFEGAGITVISFLGESIAEVVENIKILGKATGQNQEAEELTDAMLEKKDEIVEKVKDQESVKVFYEIWHDPLMGAGKGSFMDELITLTGAQNIAEDADGAYPQYDVEQLIERDTDVYLTSQAMDDITEESIKARPGYESLTAIKNDRIHLFKGTEADMVSRPGPRIVDALELVAKAIYPDAFK